jgi:glyoxylase-like metal-dependent hydrolase (beta-lactamase superfamily II)
LGNFLDFKLINIPIPLPLESVNCYLRKSEAGWHIIDTGFHTPEAEEMWIDVFRKLRIAPQDVAEIVLTHFHPDHLGMAGWLQEYTHAPVKLSKVDYHLAETFWYQGLEGAIFRDLAIQHGMQDEQAEIIFQYLNDFLKFVRPLPEITTFDEGEIFNWGEEYQAILTPGHSDGHIVFYCKANRTAVAGDFLLSNITPNIGYFPGFDENPLQSYLQSLENIDKYPMEHVLPGHKKPVVNSSRRAKEIAEHHHERLEKILTMIDKPLTAYELCLKYFFYLDLAGKPLQTRFALAEILSHLIYLEKKGRVNRELHTNGKILFNLAEH